MSESNLEEIAERAESNLVQARNITDDILTKEEQISEYYHDSGGKDRARNKVRMEGELDTILKQLEIRLNTLLVDVKDGNSTGAKEEMDAVKDEIEDLKPVVRELLESAEQVGLAIPRFAQLASKSSKAKTKLAESVKLSKRVIASLEVLNEDLENIEDKLEEINNLTGVGSEVMELIQNERTECRRGKEQLESRVSELPDQFLSQIAG